MTALVDIGNRALQLIGTRTTMTLTEFAELTSNEALQINLIITPILNWCFGLANWNFARAVSTLTLLKGPPPTPAGNWSSNYPQPPWLYEYSLPTSFVRAVYLTNMNAGITSGWLGEPRRFTMGSDIVDAVQQEVLLTNESKPVLVYTTNVSDPTGWPFYFERLASIALAQAVCLVLTGDKKIWQELSMMLEQQISIAMQINTSEGLIIDDSTPEWIQAIGMNYPYRRVDGMVGYQTPATQQQQSNQQRGR